MSEPLDDEEEFTELVDADIPRLDLVGKGANGLPFLIAKADAGAGVLSPDIVRGLIVNAERGRRFDRDAERDQVTITGTHAAIAKMIHDAAQRATVEKKDFDTAERKHDAATGAAMPDGSYPIENTTQLEDAIHAVGRAAGGHDAVRRHIMQRARSLGAESSIPDNWNADGSLKEGDVTKQDVAKADLPDVDEPLPDADDVADDEGIPAGAGDPDDPDSAAWELVDAARAQEAIDLTVALLRLLQQACDRENQEVAVSGDEDDACNAMSLEAAISAAQCILGILAPFQVTETAEAGELAAERDQMVKSLQDGRVVKAGRVLSGVNEQRVRQASSLLQEVLASLPAPVENDTVAKEEAMDDTTQAAQVAAENVEKAKGDPQMAVFDANGNLVGTIDPGDLSPIASTEPPAGGDSEGASDDADDAAAQTADGAPADANDGPAAPAPDAQAAPPAPADATADDDGTQVAKSFSDDQVELLKSIVGGALEAAVSPLRERLEMVESQPLPGGPMLNGAGFGAGGVPALRGQDDGSDPHAELRKQAADEKDPVRKAALQEQLAAAQMKAIFGQGR